MYRHRRSYNRTTSPGLRAAQRHIEEAEILSQELGGTDSDVKDWFFRRSPRELDAIINVYRKTYGSDKANYAKTTFADWKSGKRRMSGVVAERLFKIIPRMMPLKDKYALVESLWKHVGPKRKRLVKCGTEAPVDDVVRAVEQEVKALTTTWEIPDALTNRFKWLSANDSTTYQKLMSHIKAQEKKLGEQTLKHQIPQLKAKYSEMSDISSRLSYTVNVEKQSVELRISGSTEKVTASNWHEPNITRTGQSKEPNNTFVWWCVGAIALLYYMAI
jgi:hypothetical protein